MVQQLSEPLLRSYGIGLTLLTLATLSILELFLSYIIGLLRLTLLVVSICLVGAEFLVWSHGDDLSHPGGCHELDYLNSWEDGRCNVPRMRFQ